MIIWLASYPRSGNTLLRIMIQNFFGISSYVDDKVSEVFLDTPVTDNAIVGHKNLPTSWQEFYSNATKSPEKFFVKTHKIPIDDQPYIYIVRDGRMAIQSYRDYYLSFFPDLNNNIFQLIMGDDYYGNWTTHYQSWNDRENINRLILHFEELVALPNEALTKIAQFLSLKKTRKTWENPFGELHTIQPKFFRHGHTEFIVDAGWSRLANHIFNLLHGGLMIKLGYPLKIYEDDEEKFSGINYVCSLVKSLLDRSNNLQKICDERSALIDRIHCEAIDRLKLIEHLRDEANKRLEIIQDLQSKLVLLQDL